MGKEILSFVYESFLNFLFGSFLNFLFKKMSAFYHSRNDKNTFSSYPRASKVVVWGLHGNYEVTLHWELDDYFGLPLSAASESESVFSSLPYSSINSWATIIEEEGHDSGVDESTQAKENGAPSRSTSKGSKGSPRKRTSRSTDPSPMKGRSPQSTASSERKLPMNKIQVGTTASPNLKSVRSKIGSLENATHKPGGGRVKIESKKIDFTKQAASRITAKNEAYTPGGGEKKIESQKLQWKAQSKVGSMDNKTHKPGGGDKKIESRKIDVKGKSKVGSKDNIKHKAGGGDVQIESKKLEFKDKAASKVGSLANVKHKAGGGESKIFDDKEYIRQMSSPAKTPSKQTSRATSRASSESGRISPGGVMEEEDQVVQVTTSQGVTPSEE